jgi:hypothetical protein
MKFKYQVNITTISAEGHSERPPGAALSEFGGATAVGDHVAKNLQAKS